MNTTKSIFKSFRLSDDEYAELCREFGNLCKYEAWQLIRKNVRNNHTDDMEDIEQDLLIAVIRAGVYYKRQVYIQECLQAAERHASDPFLRGLVAELVDLWANRTKHGANKQKFGEPQERLLERIVRRVVPAAERPDKSRRLRIDKEFRRYCKQITWNQQKSLGRKITRERSIRVGLVSLSEFEYVASNCG